MYSKFQRNGCSTLSPAFSRRPAKHQKFLRHPHEHKLTFLNLSRKIKSDIHTHHYKLFKLDRCKSYFILHTNVISISVYFGPSGVLQASMKYHLHVAESHQSPHDEHQHTRHIVGLCQQTGRY